MTPRNTRSDVVVIGAGMVGAACAYYAARAGLAVTVLDRGPVGGGTTGAGEGNLLLSDKGPGPELALAQRSMTLWRELAGADDGGAGGDGGFAGPFGRLVEYEAKGGLVVARSDADFASLAGFAASQRSAGVVAEEVPADRLRELEPLIAPDLAGGFLYPEDAQVMPTLAAAHVLRASGAPVRTGVTVTGIVLDGSDAVTGVRTSSEGTLACRFVVNAAGFQGADIASLVGTRLPIQPRRGFVLVTEPLPRLIRRKVYSAAYVADVASSDADLQSSAVVEGTQAGPVLIGASRERVGHDRTPSIAVLRRLAAQAIELFPFLAEVEMQRYYRGFRPYLPDHLPAIGPDPSVAGLFHACGHEGAGIGLAPATGELIAALMSGAEPAVDADPFSPRRFAEAAA